MIQDCGVNLNKKTISDHLNSSLLSEAFAYRQIEMIKTLAATAGCDTNPRGRGQSIAAALCIAIEKGDEDIARELVGLQGCNLDIQTEKGHLLHLAVQCQSPRIVKILLGTGKCNVNFKDVTGRTPLHQAAQSCQEDIILQLLEDPNCDVDAKSDLGETVLYTAIRQGALSIFKMVLESGRCNVNLGEAGYPKETPLHTAVRLGSTQMYRMLLETGKCNLNAVDTSGNTPLNTAVRLGSTQICRVLLETGKCNLNAVDTSGSTPLHTAVRLGFAQICRVLLETGKCNLNVVDTFWNTPLHTAVRLGFTQICRALLETGKCNLNVVDTFWNTPLHTAVRRGFIQMCRMLLETGKCNVNIGDNVGDTPLHAAIRYEYTQTFEMILETGKCNVNIGDDIGNTPFHEACRCGHEYIISLLLKVANCDMNIRNRAKRTALHEAINSGHFSVAKMLLGTGKCDIDTRDTLGNTPLDTAATHNRESIWRHLKDISRSNSAENNAFDEAAENSVISIINMLLGCGKYNDFSIDDYLLGNHSRKKLVESEGHEDILGIFLQIELQKRENTWDPIVEFFKAVRLGRITMVKILLTNGEIPAGTIAVSPKANLHGRVSWVHLFNEDPETGVLTGREDIIRLLTLDLASIEEIASLTKHYSPSSPAVVTHEDVNHLPSPFQYSDGSLEKLSSQDADDVFAEIVEQEVCEHKDIIEGVCFGCWMTFPIDYMPPVLPGNPVVVPPLDTTPQELNS